MGEACTTVAPSLTEQVEWVKSLCDQHDAELTARGEARGEGFAMINAVYESLARLASLER